MTQADKSYDTAKVKKLAKSQVEITASVSASIWEKYRGQALKNINDSITLEGFRKGKVPENILVSKVGEMAVLEEIAELVISKSYIEILIDEKMDALGKPEIRVTKLAKDNPLEFVAVTSVVPEITLPDYSKIAKEQNKKSGSKEIKVVDKDIEDAILRIRKQHASHEGHDHDKMTPEEHDKAVEAAMPELTDDFVKTLGDFNDVPDFKNKLSAMIAEQKRDEAREKLRIQIADAIVVDSKIDLPEVMITSELERTQAQFSADLERMGVKLDDYLKHAKKTLEDIRKEWRPHAEKKAKLQLILNEIAKKENVRPDQKEIDQEVKHIVEHYKDADRERAGVYAETVLTNERVFRFLEDVK
jgi:trigger factor